MVHHQTDRVTLHQGDCLDVLRELSDCSVDAVVTDPPYGISFMGKQWDQPGQYGSRLASTGLNHRRGDKDAALEAGKYDLSPHAMRNFQSWVEAWAAECLRILKPGGHLLAFGGARTWHRLAGGIEDAGFEIRDSIAWLYGSGFPKSLDVSKAIDKAAGVEFAGRPAEGVGFMRPDGRDGYNVTKNRLDRVGDSTLEAAHWQGWGTALKPAFEPVVVGRKPLEGTVAANVLAHGTGALNVDGCRVGDGGGTASTPDSQPNRLNKVYGAGMGGLKAEPLNAGRWPANVILDEDAAAELDEQVGSLSSGLARTGERARSRGGEIYGKDAGYVRSGDTYGDTGGASRFFYTAKAGADERPRVDGVAHPTVKPLALMRWLVRLVTPPDGVVLEPFAGSGTTVAACLLEGFRCVAIEREADYLPLIVTRIDNPLPRDVPRAKPIIDEPDQPDVFSALADEESA